MDWQEFVRYVSERLNSGDTLEELCSGIEGTRFRWTGVLYSKRLSTDDPLLRPTATIKLPTEWISTGDGVKVKCEMIVVVIKHVSLGSWEACQLGQKIDFSFTLQSDGPFQCIRLLRGASGAKRLSLCCSDGVCKDNAISWRTASLDRRPVPKLLPVRCQVIRDRKEQGLPIPQGVLNWSQRQLKRLFDIQCRLSEETGVTFSIIREFWSKVFNDGMQRSGQAWSYLIADVRIDVGLISAQFCHSDLRTTEPVCVSISLPKLATTDLDKLSRQLGIDETNSGRSPEDHGLLTVCSRILFAPLSEDWAEHFLLDLAKSKPRKRIVASLDCDWENFAEFVWSCASPASFDREKMA